MIDNAAQPRAVREGVCAHTRRACRNTIISTFMLKLLLGYTVFKISSGVIIQTSNADDHESCCDFCNFDSKWRHHKRNV